MKYRRLIISIIVIIVLVVVVHQNEAALSTSVSFGVGLDIFAVDYRSAEISLYYLLPLVFLIGVLVTSIVGIRERFLLKKQIRLLDKASKEKDEELNSLRNLPITSDSVVSDHLNGTDEQA